MLEAKHAARVAAKRKASAKPKRKRKAKRRRKGRKAKRRRKAKPPSKLVAAKRAVAQALRDMRAAQRAYSRAEARVSLTKGRLVAAQWSRKGQS